MKNIRDDRIFIIFDKLKNLPTKQELNFLKNQF